MKKKIIIISVIVLVIIVAITFFILKNNHNGSKDDVLSYPSDVKCELSGYDTINGKNVKTDTNVYLTIKDDYVTFAIYQIISHTKDEVKLSSIMEQYNDIDGITMYTEKYEDYSILTMKYDYNTIDIKEVRDKMGEFIDDKSIFNRYEKFPINYGQYKTIELRGYECHED